MLSRWKLAFACGAATFGASLPALAQAVPDCSTVPEFANAVFGAGGSAVSPTLSEVARAVASSNAPAEEKFTIFYWAPSACTGYRAFNDGVSPATAQTFTYYVAGATAALGRLPADVGSRDRRCAPTRTRRPRHRSPARAVARGLTTDSVARR